MKIKLQQATLIKRYKRFLADITLKNGAETTLHVANTGAMSGCAIPNDTVWYSTSDNQKRKYPFSWELTQTQEDHFICVNTIRANQLAEQAILNNAIAELQGFKPLKREVKYGDENSKIDFHLTSDNDKETFIEVKSVTLLDSGQGYFPDAVTVRGQKHLRELITVAQQGHRAVLLFAVLHSGINNVKPAAHIDKTYADLLKKAKLSGVEIIAYKASFQKEQQQFNVALSEKIPVIIESVSLNSNKND